MVFYFTSSEGHTIYMGRDKFENEELIRHGFLEDIWFHVDDLSSAHVYLRLPMGKSALDDVSETCLEECAQLVKENSIEGSKKKSVEVIYTKWRNLKKTKSMEVGQVGFNHPERVRTYRVAEKDRDILKALNKTKVEKSPDLEEERRQRELLYKAERKKQRQLIEASKKLEASADLSSGIAMEEPTAAEAEAAAEQRVANCLRVLAGNSDEHKFVGLLMVTKLSDLPLARLQLVRRQVLAAVGTRFFVRLLHTRDTDANDSLSSFQTLGLNLIASFCSDEEVAEAFADDKLVKFLLGVLETTSSTAQSQQARDDCVAILTGIARTAKGTQLLLGDAVLAQVIDAVRVEERRVHGARSLSDGAESGGDQAADGDYAAAALAALWSLVGLLAGDPAFWIKPPQTLAVAEFVCAAFADAGGAEAIAVLAVLNRFLTLVKDGAVAFAVLAPHLDHVRMGVDRFLRRKWPHQERDECLRLLLAVLPSAGRGWLLAPATKRSLAAANADADAASGGKFAVFVLKLVSIEIKLMLDDVELALVQIDELEVEHVEETERQEREVQRVLQMLPVCFGLVELIIQSLVACVDDGEDSDGDSDEAATVSPVSADVLLELKKSFDDVFDVIIEFLTLAREFMKTHRYRALKESAAPAVYQLDAVVFAAVRVTGAWIAEDSDSCMAQLVELVPFLVLYEPLAPRSSSDAVALLSPQFEALDSDDEVDEPAEVASAGAGATGEPVRYEDAEVLDQLHFLVPGLLQLSATTDGASALTEDVAVLRRLLRFCCALCSDVDDANSVGGVPGLTLALGVLLNLLLEKDDAPPPPGSAPRHVGEWRRALAFLLPVVCASGLAVMNDCSLSADELGDDDRSLMLLHALCVVLLIVEMRGSSSRSSSRVSAGLARLVAPFNAILAWVARHPPSVENEAATDLFELVRILSLRTKVTLDTLLG
ncbi:hypothetical protein PybrP1_003710 [[Pythium] brassicae (nom. inval.)]|nr:hypothetical protein PybrP1_003710 [[Pythium] brassicae (nom. inval.)]